MRARVKTHVVLVLSLLGLAAGVSAAANYSPPSTDAFLQGIKSYPFVASAARREKVRVGVPQLQRCMPTSEVRRLVGDPDYGVVAYRSGSGGKVPSTSIWYYVLEKRARVETEPSSRVAVWFDESGKVKAATVYGATDIEASVSRREQTCP